jgi:hypothetical protein
MPMLTKPSFGPRVALIYVTVGALLCVWTLVWYFTREYELAQSQWFWVAGIFLSGITFVVLGLILGPLGRAAREAEMPPSEATKSEAAIQQTAASNPGNGANAAAAAMPPPPPGTNPAAVPPGRPAAQPAPGQPSAVVAPQAAQ